MRFRAFSSRGTALVLVLFAISACARSEPPRQAVETSISDEGMGGGDDLPRIRKPSKPITPGQYRPLLDTPEEREAGQRAEAADAAKPRFRGWVNGVFVGAQLDDSVAPFPCKREDVIEIGEPEQEALLGQSPYWFNSPSYLPPGTSEWTYPLGQSCGSAPAFGVEKQYLVKGGGELTIYRTWKRFFPQDFATGRVRADTVGERPAVVIPPLTPEGFGETHVIIQEPSGGTLRVSGFAMPLSEVQRIAEALLEDLRQMT